MKIDYKNFWVNSEWSKKEYILSSVTEKMIEDVETELGYKLPLSYIELMKSQNGGVPKNTLYSNEEVTIEITGIFGIGKEKNCSLCGDCGSKFWVKEWDYPDIGVYICDTPTAGHDMIALDYSECGKEGEPKVVHVDQENDYEIIFLAETFEDFIKGLENEEDFEM